MNRTYKLAKRYKPGLDQWGVYKTGKKIKVHAVDKKTGKHLYEDHPDKKEGHAGSPKMMEVDEVISFSFSLYAWEINKISSNALS